MNGKKDAIVIFAGNVARKLLKRGYTIIDVKADREIPLKSVFIFRRENDIEKVLAEITSKK